MEAGLCALTVVPPLVEHRLSNVLPDEGRGVERLLHHRRHLILGCARVAHEGLPRLGKRTRARRGIAGEQLPLRPEQLAVGGDDWPHLRRAPPET